MTKNTENNENTSKWVLNKDSAISMGVVISMITVAVWTTSSHEMYKNTIENLKKENQTICQRLSQLEEKETRHEAKGINGMPHPESIVKYIEETRAENERSMSDRWKKADDYIFMKEFCIINKLQMPPHSTMQELAKKGG